MTRHVLNWLRPTQMVCSVAATPTRLACEAQTIKEIDCPGCSLRILRTGQALGLSEDNIRDWNLAWIRANFTAAHVKEEPTP